MTHGNPDLRGSAEAEFVQRALQALPTEAVSPALEARILADFDAMAARLRASPALARAVRAWSEAVWPGAPAWMPLVAVSLSLMIGIAAGTLVPSAMLTTNGTTQAQTDVQTLASDISPALDLTGDL